MAETIALIDFGAGNLHSVHNALMAAGAGDVVVTDDPAVVTRADRIILPGVGAFGACRDALFAIDGMIDALEQRVRKDGVPFLGICVGMQLLAVSGSEHGEHKGLGWCDGHVEKIPSTRNVKIPHMGWNYIDSIGGNSMLPNGEAYFLHSYHYIPGELDFVAAVTDHGGPIVAAISQDSIIGVQFHPEKSQKYGLSFLNGFLRWKP